MLRLAEILEEEAPEATRRRRIEFAGSRRTKSEETAREVIRPSPRRAVSQGEEDGITVVESTVEEKKSDLRGATDRRGVFAANRSAKIDSTDSLNEHLMEYLSVSTSRSTPSPSSPPISSSDSSSPPLRAPPTLVLPSTLEVKDDSKRAFKSPPLICEQGPSAPSSPTSPGGSRLKRPSPIIVSDDISYRINLMQGGSGFPDISKMSLLSPGGYATSDLGSSPRSSFSAAQGSPSQSPLLLGPWNAFRDNRDDDGSECGESRINKDLLSPGMMLSPAPFSPFSDYRSDCDTPYSSYARSPNLSPHLPIGSLHFSFEPNRSASSMSHRASVQGESASLLVPLDSSTRERSRSDSEMCGHSGSEERDEQMDTSCVSVPVAAKKSGQYKKRLLQKYEQEQERRPAKQRSTSSPPPGSATESEVDEFDMRSISRRCSRQPTVDETSSFSNVDLTAGLQESLGQQKQIDMWMEQQMAALQQLYRNHELHARLLQAQSVAATAQMMIPLAEVKAAPSLTRQTTVEGTTAPLPPVVVGPIKTPTLWRRSRSESDVSINHQQFICEHCGQAFALHDRLAKHIASRHRDRTPSQNEENKTHKCTLCSKSFGRSDMLTRHMRLHTGHKPYGCQLCGQVFSRSDHLSTHQRTHTGEKPYQCPLCAYAASRRDMITRHMRTHLRPDGLPLDITAQQIHQISLICGLNPATADLRSIMAVIGSSSLDDYGTPGSSSTQSIPPSVPPSDPSSSPPRVGSGPFSAFQPTGKLLSAPPPPLIHSLSTPSSPSLSRQASIGGISPLP